MSFIEDGTGSGSKAKVNTDNELIVRSVSEDADFDLITKGRGFFVSHSTTLTDAVDTPVMIFTNNTTSEIIVPAFVIGFTASNESTGTNNQKQSIGVSFKLGAITHDLAIPGVVLPYKASNAVSTAGIDVFLGTTGNTATTAPLPPVKSYLQGGTHYQNIINRPFFLAPGDNTVLFLEPPAGNTSLSLSFTATFLINDGTL